MWTYIPNRLAETRDLLLLLLLLLLLWLLRLQVKLFPFVLALAKNPGQTQEELGVPLHLLPRDRPPPRESHDVTDITWVIRFLEIGCVTPVISTKIPGWPVMKDGVPLPLVSPLFFQAPLVYSKGVPLPLTTQIWSALSKERGSTFPIFWHCCYGDWCRRVPPPLTTQQWH